MSIGTNFDGSIDMLREFERLMPEGGGADAMFDDVEDEKRLVEMVVMEEVGGGC